MVNFPPPTIDRHVRHGDLLAGFGLVLPRGTTTVTCTATGRLTTCTFTVTVRRHAAAYNHLSGNVTAVTPIIGRLRHRAVVTFPPPTASDNCPGVTVAVILLRARPSL